MKEVQLLTENQLLYRPPKNCYYNINVYTTIKNYCPPKGKTIGTPKIVDERSVTKEHPKTETNLSKPIKQSEIFT